MHDDGTLVEDVIYTFSFFRFHLFPLPLRLIFQLREFLGNESDGIACSLLGPAPLSVFLLPPLPPIPRAKATIFHPSLARRSSDPLTATSTSRYVPGKSYALYFPCVSFVQSQSAPPIRNPWSTINRHCLLPLVAPVD